jgi:hypothetical protein
MQRACCIGLIAQIGFLGLASADELPVTLLDGKLSFSVSEDWQTSELTNTTLEIESRNPKTWRKCSIKTGARPSFGRDQAEENSVLRQYTGPSMQEGEARHYTSFEERQGVVVFKFGSTAYDTTSEGRQFFLVDSHHTQVVSIMCFVYAEEKAETFPAVMAFLDSMTIAGR